MPYNTDPVKTCVATYSLVKEISISYVLQALYVHELLQE